jgi:hypothetical protein
MQKLASLSSLQPVAFPLHPILNLQFNNHYFFVIQETRREARLYRISMGVYGRRAAKARLYNGLPLKIPVISPVLGVNVDILVDFIETTFVFYDPVIKTFLPSLPDQGFFPGIFCNPSFEMINQGR